MEAGDGARDVHALLEEQAALRRVATLVAAAGEPSRVFSTVTEEVGRLLGAQTANMVRYRHDGTADVVCERDQAVPPPAQEAMSARAGTVHRLESSHSPFLSRPDEVTEIVVEALAA